MSKSLLTSITTCLELCRISNLPTVWTNVLAGCLLTSPTLEPSLFLLLALSMSCLYLGGMCLNDVCDAEYDRVQRPARPIPSGRISPAHAVILMLVLFACGLGLLSGAPHRTGIAGALLLLSVIILYDLRHKQNPLSVLLMAICRFLVFVVSALALSGHVPALVLLAAGAQFVYVVLISLVARHENSRKTSFTFPVIPFMLAGISLLDGIVLALLVAPVWLIAGLAGAALTWAGQRIVRGD